MASSMKFQCGKSPDQLKASSLSALEKKSTPKPKAQGIRRMTKHCGTYTYRRVKDYRGERILRNGSPMTMEGIAWTLNQQEQLIEQLQKEVERNGESCVLGENDG